MHTRRRFLSLLITAVTLLAASVLAAEPNDVITVTLRNDAGFTASRIQVRAEAFRFDVPSLAPGASITRTVPRTGGNCGVTARFASGGAEHLAAAALLLPDKSAPLPAAIRLRLTGLKTLQASPAELRAAR